MPGMEGWRAAYFRISGDKAYFYGCGFYGAQDTLCDDADRHYFKDCYIEGSIDFIFGNGRSMYKDRNNLCGKTYFIFVNCKVAGTGKLYVGRAMGWYSRIIFAYTYFDDVIAPGGWDNWDHTKARTRQPSLEYTGTGGLAQQQCAVSHGLESLKARCKTLARALRCLRNQLLPSSTN